MSVRPIDADALKEHIQSYAGMFTDEGFMVNLGAILRGVDFQPTLDDLRPKGRWIMKETMIRSPFAKNAYCSECNEETSFLHDFCPSCGADMRGGDTR